MPSPLLFVAFYGYVVAIDQKTGTNVWETATHGGRTQLTAHKERVYAASERSGLLVLNAKDGTIIQKTPLSGRGQAPTILIDEETVFVTSGGELQAFDLDGKLLWTNTFKGKGNGTMAIATQNKDRQGDEY